MKKVLSYVGILLVAVFMSSFTFVPVAHAIAAMQLTSSAFINNGNIPMSYTSYGSSDPIPLNIANVPVGAQSLAIIVDDPDAEGGSFAHWVIWDFSTTTTTFDTTNLPLGAAVGVNTNFTNDWFPPGPPPGNPHHYVFTLYALDTPSLGIATSSFASDLITAMDGHIIATSTWTGLYDSSGPSVVINEFKLDGIQWVELINTTSNDINLTSSTWQLVSTEMSPGGTATTTLSGLLPAKGLITFAPTSTFSSSFSTILSLKNNGTTVYAVSYGNSSFGFSEPHLSGFPGGDESGILISGSSWGTTSSPTRGWYNEAPAPTINEIIAAINIGGIVTNMGTLDDPTVATGLYFEKRTDINDPDTALGKLTFVGPLNLTNASTTALLQDLGNKMEAAAGSMKFDARTANDLRNAGASISIYKINTLGYDINNLDLFDITIKDDLGVVIATSSPNYPNLSSLSTSSANSGTFEFTTNHFTQFGFNPILTEISPVGVLADYGSLNYTFYTNVAGSVIYGGACAMEPFFTTIGNNNITFGPLGLGTYSNCTVTVVDGIGASTTIPVSTFTVVDSAADTEAVAADKEALIAASSNLLGGNSEWASITTNTAALPSLGTVNSSAITWVSAASTTVISSDGQTIHRPAYGNGSISTTLTATIRKNLSVDTYVIELSVLEAPPSTNTIITSGTYIVGISTITNVPYGTSLETFVAALTKSEPHQAWYLSYLSDPVVTGEELIVTAQDEITTKIYTVTVNANPDIAAVAVAKAKINTASQNSDFTNLQIIDTTNQEQKITALQTAVNIAKENSSVSATVTWNEGTGYYDVEIIKNEITDNYTITTATFSSFNADEAAVVADEASLTADSIKGDNVDILNITYALSLSVYGYSSSSDITWISASTTLVSNNGQVVNRPAYGHANATTTLTAIITKNLASTTKIFNLTILAETTSVPGVPTNLSVMPSTLTNNPRPALSWSPVVVNPAVIDYVIYIYHSYDSDEIYAQYSGISTTSFTLPEVFNDGDYTWEMRARNDLGYSNWVEGPGFTIDTTAPTVIKLGDGLTDYILTEENTNLTFNEYNSLSSSSKTVIQNAISSGADRSLSFSWLGSTLTIIATNTPTTFANDVIVNISDTAGNATSGILIIDSALEETQITPDASGEATISTSTPEVVLTNPTATTTLTINSDVTNPTIDVSAFINSNGTGTLPAINITSDNANGTEVAIPASTVVTSASTTWNGVIGAPVVVTVTLPPESGQTKTLSTAIEVGFAGEELTFSKAVKLVIPNQAGKRVGYTRNGGTTFTEITISCDVNSQDWADVNLDDGEDCKTTHNDDLVIWTKHFTTFAAYSQTTNSSIVSSGGGWLTPVFTPQPVVAAVTTSAPTSQYNFTRDLTIGATGADVTELQKILVAEGHLVMPAGAAYGYFGSLTQSALVKYQKVKGITPAAGYFGSKTRKSIASLNTSVTQGIGSISNAANMTLKELVQLLLQIGAVAPDKIDAANKLVNSL